MKQFFYVFCVAVAFAAYIFIGCSGGNGDNNNPNGSSSSAIVGTWEATGEEYSFYWRKEYVFNSNNTGTFWEYQNSELAGAKTITWSYANGRISVSDAVDVGGQSGSFTYNNGNTFTLLGETYTRINNNNCNSNRPNIPVNLEITANSSDSVWLSWNAVQEAKAYVIYPSRHASLNPFTDWGKATTENSISISWSDYIRISQGETAYIMIRAINDCGESGNSAAVSAIRP